MRDAKEGLQRKSMRIRSWIVASCPLSQNACVSSLNGSHTFEWRYNFPVFLHHEVYTLSPHATSIESANSIEFLVFYRKRPIAKVS